MEICNGVDYLDQVKELIIEYYKAFGTWFNLFKILMRNYKIQQKNNTAPEGEILVAVEDEKGDRNGCLSSPFKESLWNEMLVCKTKI